MRHKQILDELAVPTLVQAMDEDLAGWVGRRLREIGGTPAEVRRRAVTFLRPADVVSIELDAAFHAAFVLQLHDDKGGQCPVIEFYAGRFPLPPTARQLAGRPAAGGVRFRHARFSVWGLTHLPDPARQVRLVARGHPDKPLSAPSRPGEGRYTVTDPISLQQSMMTLFADTGE
ncbi:hypothetical protein [Planobispora takensis]|uniref:Uncharacterized protein n=1 Tax=Planobispora takensis TaxID=1367882 RepID=A0A8J3T2T3_9ACTN|nr:hypothetical protein [Planobispora takensis]GII04206.1 hypothetical protein Pta02_62140 [Planobispora takensis]